MREIVIAFLLSFYALGANDVFVCPMDPEVRASSPGKCPRCGMTLVSRVPEPVEYPLELRVEPPQIPANQNIKFAFRILDPKTSKPVTRFDTVHEKLMHLFLVSYDLSYFSHEHPVLGPDGWFTLNTQLPKPGSFKLISDFYPEGGTPQLVTKTFSTAGFVEPLERSVTIPPPDLLPKQGANTTVELKTDPESPIAGTKTMLFVHVSPSDGLEQFIGAWAHLLAVSSDLIDTVHSHPFIADGGQDMQFNLFFPRPGTYRVWIQLQRKGIVNTVSFTIPVDQL